MSGFGLGVVILAAGASSRMGRPKMLLPWGGRTVIRHIWETWNGLGACPVAVVCGGHNVQELRQELSSGELILNPEPERGMFSSIQCAARWARGWSASHWALTLCDQPHLRPGTLERLIDAARRHPAQVCQPFYRGRRRHPVVFPRSVFEEASESDAAMLREFLERRSGQIHPVEADDPGLGLDIDTPQDYARALLLAFPGEVR